MALCRPQIWNADTTESAVFWGKLAIFIPLKWPSSTRIPRHKHIDTYSWSNPVQKLCLCLYTALTVSCLLARVMEKLFQSPQRYRNGTSIHDSWIWSLAMRDFTAACPPSLSVSLSLPLLTFSPLLALTKWVPQLQRSSYCHSVVIWCSNIETRSGYDDGQESSMRLTFDAFPFKTVGGFHDANVWSITQWHL